MKVVYLLQKGGSKWQDNELRYSIRSLIAAGYDPEITIIGHKPEWLDGISHIEMSDKSDKVTNIAAKIRKAAEVLDGEFLLMSDDIFLLSPLSAKAYTTGTLSQVFKKIRNNFGYVMKRQALRLKSKGFLDRYYGYHSPQFCTPEQIEHTFILEAGEIGGDAKALVGNINALEAKEIKDCKLRYEISELKLKEWLNGLEFFSISDMALCRPVIEFLQKKFPNVSKFEADKEQAKPAPKEPKAKPKAKKKPTKKKANVRSNTKNKAK